MYREYPEEVNAFDENGELFTTLYLTKIATDLKHWRKGIRESDPIETIETIQDINNNAILDTLKDMQEVACETGGIVQDKDYYLSCVYNVRAHWKDVKKRFKQFKKCVDKKHDIS